MIKGGYYLKARKIQESAIARMPPHVREIWDWLLMKAMFANGTHLQRGQVLATYDDIREGLHWFIGWRKMMYSKWDCEKAMKLLVKATMIATEKTTRGLIITILNYSEYQDPKNYESHNESHRKATRKPQTTDTIDKNDKNDNKNVIEGDTPTLSFNPPSVESVSEYCRSRNNNVDPDTFIDFYTAKNWMIGKNKMKDWKAAVRTWETRHKETNTTEVWER